MCVNSRRTIRCFGVFSPLRFQFILLVCLITSRITENTTSPNHRAGTLHLRDRSYLYFPYKTNGLNLEHQDVETRKSDSHLLIAIRRLLSCSDIF